MPEPEAACLATVADGRPSARMVLVRTFDDRGAVFYTNDVSRKGHELQVSPVAALVWRWTLVDRQVRVEGTVMRVTPAESDAYFASRERGSQLSAWASEQSSVLAGAEVLVERMAAMELRFAGAAVPRPPWWGGWRVVPTMIEFWQGRPSRLHERNRFVSSPGGWRHELLAP